MKRILIPTDFSDNARVATDYALNMFQGMDYHFDLVNGYHTPHAGASMLVSLVDIMEKDSKEALQIEKEHICAQFGIDATRVDTHSVYGDCISAVDQLISGTLKPEYIVIGTKGESNLMDKLIGSNTAYIMKHTKIPIIAVPIHAKMDPIKEVVLATDYEPMVKANQVLSPLTPLMKHYSAHIQVLHINTEKELITDDGLVDHNRFIAQELDEFNATYTTVKDADINKGIHSYLENYPSDLLVMISHDYGFFKSIFHSSVSKQMVVSSNIPVMILHK